MKDFDEVEKELYEQIMGETAAAYEMAMERRDVIDVCLGLGKRFIEHFHKIYTMKKKNYIHHCKEMQAWLDKVNSLKLKPNSKLLSVTHKYDWFFTAGSSPDYFLKDDNEVEAYEKFVVQLQANPSLKIIEALKEYNK